MQYSHDAPAEPSEMPPLVSVVIPAYNAAATIRRAVDSALAQTYHPIEVIVIDDCSQDATSEVMSTYADERIRLLCLPYNHGAGGVLNPGIAIAEGEYVAFLDADDEWLPEKLAIQIPVLERNPRATMINCGCRCVDLSGNTAIDPGTPPPGVAKGDLWRTLLAASHVLKSCIVARASALRLVGPFDSRLRTGEDQDMWIRLAMVGEIEFVPDILTVYYGTPGSVTRTHARDADRYVLPMVRRNIERRRHDLSQSEIRYILAVRYTTLGRSLYRDGVVIRGAALILRAILLGYNIGQNLCYLLTASPPVRQLKRRLRRRLSLTTAPPVSGTTV